MAGHYRYTDSREVAVDPLVAWQVLTDHDRMAEWMPARKVILEAAGSPDRDGVGAIRAIHSFGTVIRERITTFDAPTTLRYELLSGLPFRRYTGQITVEPHDSGSRISTEISFSTVLPGSQLLVAIAIRVASARAARAAGRRAS
ncbi:SRPBCC family protein [Mycobacterium sp. NPDC051198]